MKIDWLTVIVDMPADGFDVGAEFWRAVTGAELSARRGADDEFASLLAGEFDTHLRVQRLAAGSPRIHVDLHVGSIPEAHARAAELGARTVLAPVDGGIASMTSPGGLAFCLVDHGPEGPPAPAIASPAPHVVDQVCIDIPSSSFDAEVSFWSELTDWPSRSSKLSEFSSLQRPPHIPIRLLLQRLGEAQGTVGAHLDLACGTEVATIMAAHNDLGAETVDVGERWTVMRDPAGQIYCLTFRDPATGLPPQ